MSAAPDPTGSATEAAETIATPILIVGGGPVGMVLAMNLAALGVASLIVNSDPRPRWHPKGSTHNSRTMEHYRRLGLAEAIRRLGLPQDYPTDVGYFTRFTGWEIARLAMPSEGEKRRAVRAAQAADQVPEPILRCNQMYVERLLYEHLRSLVPVDCRFGWSCVDWQDHGDRVTAIIEEASSGRRAAIACAYLVGCDGGQSATRRKLGIRYSGEGPGGSEAYLDGPMVATHLRVPQFYRAVAAPRCWQYRAVNREVHTNTVALDGAGEFIFNSRLRSTDEKPDSAQIVRRFLASVGTPLEVEVIGHSTWIAGRALVAERFGLGRVLLAGDATHLFTPAGGFGMNTGIDDVANLGWKLAAMVQGWGGAGLLDTYESERRPIALRNTKAARRLGVSVSEVPIGAAIGCAIPRRRAGWASASAKCRSAPRSKRIPRRAAPRAAKPALIWRISSRNSIRSACSWARATTTLRSSRRMEAKRRPTIPMSIARARAPAAGRRISGSAMACRCSIGSAAASPCSI